MGHREVKRVALDFNAPLNQVWKGYLNPYEGSTTCPSCGGTGYNPETREISDLWYDHNGDWRYNYYVGRDGKPADRPPWQIIGNCRAWCHAITQDEVQALVDAGRLWDFTRIPITNEQHEIVRQKIAAGGNSWLPFDNGRIPTAEEVNEWSHHGIGHDSINQYVCVKARAERLGVYGLCPECGGDGYVWPGGIAQKALYEGWKEIEPPAGDGYQMWSTTSEGSPISPVFDTPEKLAEYCVDNVTIFADERLSYEQWLEIIREDTADTASMFVRVGDYVGSVANEPTAAREGEQADADH